MLWTEEIHNSKHNIIIIAVIIIIISFYDYYNKELSAFKSIVEIIMSVESINYFVIVKEVVLIVYTSIIKDKFNNNNNLE